MLECWSVGVLECWSIGVLEYSTAQALLHNLLLVSKFGANLKNRSLCTDHQNQHLLVAFTVELNPAAFVARGVGVMRPMN